MTLPPPLGSMLSQVRGPKCATRFAVALDDGGDGGGPDVFVLDGGFSGFATTPARRALCEDLDARMWGGDA